MASDLANISTPVVFQQADLCSNAFPLMEEIRKQGKLCDVTIKVDDQSFSAHRIVLCATIPYFNAMFTHDMLESRQKEVMFKLLTSMPNIHIQN